MKNATAYTTDAAFHMQIASRRMQPTLILPRHAPLPVTLQEINSYIGQLLTPDEQAVCDMATD